MLQDSKAPDLLNTNITFLPNVQKPKTFEVIPLKRALGHICHGKYKDKIDAAQLDLLVGDDEGYRRKKSQLPSYCFNGTFEGKVDNTGFVQSSGLIIIDIDKLNYEQLAEKRSILANDARTVFIYESPSGLGIKSAFRVNPVLITGDNDYKIAFAELSKNLDVGAD